MSTTQAVPVWLIRVYELSVCWHSNSKTKPPFLTAGHRERRGILMSEGFLLWGSDGWLWAPQGIFGLGRHERLKGIRILADPGSLSGPWSGSSRLELEPFGSLQALDARWGWSGEVRLRLRGCTWGPALKEGRPREGGGSCLAGLARGPWEHTGLRGAGPPAPPGLAMERDARLWRPRGCSMRGRIEPADVGVTEFWGVAAGALHSSRATDWVANAGLSLAFSPRENSTPGRCRWALRRCLSLLGSAGPVTSTIMSLRAQLASVCFSSSCLLFTRSLWSSVGGVFTCLPWWRCSLRQGLEGCSIWGCKEKEKKKGCQYFF